GVSLPVFGQRFGLAGRQRNATHRRSVSVGAVGEFVDVVAQVQYRVEVRAIRQTAIDVEVARRVVRTGHLCELQTRYRLLGQRLRAADRGLVAVSVESVVVGAAGTQIPGVHLRSEERRV